MIKILREYVFKLLSFDSFLEIDSFKPKNTFWLDGSYQQPFEKNTTYTITDKDKNSVTIESDSLKNPITLNRASLGRFRDLIKAKFLDSVEVKCE